MKEGDDLESYDDDFDAEKIDDDEYEEDSDEVE